MQDRALFICLFGRIEKAKKLICMIQPNPLALGLIISEIKLFLSFELPKADAEGYSDKPQDTPKSEKKKMQRLKSSDPSRTTVRIDYESWKTSPSILKIHSAVSTIILRLFVD